MNTKNDFYIKLLEFGVSHDTGFSFNEITKDKELSSSEEKKEVIREYIERAFRSSNNFPGGYPTQETPFICIKRGNDGTNDNSKYKLTFDAYFKYIDYLELKAARTSSRRAFLTAIIAIIISALALWASIYMGGPVKINRDQFNQVIQKLEQK